MAAGSAISVFCKGAIHSLFGSHRGFGVLMAATIGVTVFSLLTGMFVDSILPL